MAEENKSHRASGATDAQNKFESSKFARAQSGRGFTGRGRSDCRRVSRQGRTRLERGPRKSRASLDRRARPSRKSVGRCPDSRPNLSGRRRTVRSRKSDQSDLYRARRGIRPRTDFPALTAISLNGWRNCAVAKSTAPDRFDRKSWSRWPARWPIFLKAAPRYWRRNQKRRSSSFWWRRFAWWRRFCFLPSATFFCWRARWSAVAHMANVSWLWVALAAAGLHFVIALIFLFVAGTGIKRPIFRATMEELKRDREWLKNLEANQPRN